MCGLMGFVKVKWAVEVYMVVYVEKFRGARGFVCFFGYFEGNQN